MPQCHNAQSTYPTQLKWVSDACRSYTIYRIRSESVDGSTATTTNYDGNNELTEDIVVHVKYYCNLCQ